MHRGLLALGFMTIAIGCGESEAEKKHKAQLKAIAAQTTNKETQAFNEGCGPLQSTADADLCLKKHLDDWRRGERGMRVRPANLLFAKLLDYKIAGIQPRDDHFLATANLQIELSGGDGMFGGGETATRRFEYKLDKRLGVISMVP